MSNEDKSHKLNSQLTEARLCGCGLCHAIHEISFRENEFHGNSQNIWPSKITCYIVALPLRHANPEHDVSNRERNRHLSVSRHLENHANLSANQSWPRSWPRLTCPKSVAIVTRPHPKKIIRWLMNSNELHGFWEPVMHYYHLAKPPRHMFSFHISEAANGISEISYWYFCCK